MDNQRKTITFGPVGKYDNLNPQVEPVRCKYADMVAMRDEGKLIPGQLYRITDYVTTTAQVDTQSAGHQFDLLVQAATPTSLSETAFATRHDGDEYFATARLEAWKLKYCLDNDVNRFAWADTEQGKGVIYEMEDEWNNRLPYDFKNIQFKRTYCESVPFDETPGAAYYAIPGMRTGPESSLAPGITEGDDIYAYTFSCFATLEGDHLSNPAQADASMGLFQTEVTMDADYGDSPRPSNNVMDPYYVSQSIDDEPLRRVRALPNITFQQFNVDEFSYHVSDNHIGGMCHDWSCRSRNVYGNNFAEANVEYCYFAEVMQCDFGSAIVKRCDYSGALIVGCDYSGAAVYNCDFSGAYIEDCNFSGADIGDCNFSGADIRRCDYSGAEVYYCDFSGAEVYNCDFSGAQIHNCDFSGSYIGDCNFSGAQMRSCDFSGARIRSCDFSGADILYCVFENSIMFCIFSHAESCIFGRGISGTGSWQHVIQTGFLKGDEQLKMVVGVALGVIYKQEVSCDANGDLVISDPFA